MENQTEKKLTASRKAQIGGVGVATILGLITQGLSVKVAACLVTAIILTNIVAQALPDAFKK